MGVTMGRIGQALRTVVLPVLFLWIKANATSQHKSTTAATVGWFGRCRSSFCIFWSNRGGFQQDVADLNITATDGAGIKSLVRETSTSIPPSSFVRHETSTSRLLEMENSSFTILSDTVLHEKWRKLTSRRVQLPSGRVADFEIVGQSNGGSRLDGDTANTDQAVLIFVWHGRTGTTTLIREYMPAVHDIRYGLAAGMVDAKHVDLARNTAANSTNATMYETGEAAQRVAAECELAEECRLVGGTWLRLTERPVVLDKYCTTALTVYLVLDPHPLVDDSVQRDDTEEGMEIHSHVTLEELQLLIQTGQFTAVGTFACLLALAKLREMGEI
jgi:hypothetical protein